MQFSGSRGESSQKTRSGLIGFAEFMALASRTFHHSAMFLSIVSRQDLSVLRVSRGRSARKVSALSPTSGTSIG